MNIAGKIDFKKTAIVLAKYMREPAKAGGVSVLAEDLIQNIPNIDVVSLNISDDKKSIKINNYYEHKNNLSLIKKIIFWCAAVINLARFCILNRNQYDCVISCTMASSLVLPIIFKRKCIIWENIDFLKKRKKLNIIRIWIALKFNSTLIITTHEEFDNLNKIYPKYNEKIILIYNWTRPLRNEFLEKKIDIVGIGFYEPRKGFDILLNNLPANAKSPKISLFGGGYQSEYLRKIILDRKLENVTINDFSSDGYSLIEESKAIVIPSRFEGFPLVLIHALNCGILIGLSDRVSDSLKMKKLFPKNIKLLRMSDEAVFVNDLEIFFKFVDNFNTPINSKNISIFDRDLNIAKIIFLINDIAASIQK